MTTDREAIPPAGSQIEQLAADAEFREAIGYCMDAMAQNDARGETLVFFRENARLRMRRVKYLELGDLDRYEMILFDGGNTCGDLWKHVFFPRLRREYFVYEAD